jgi:hypothetical protein
MIIMMKTSILSIAVALLAILPANAQTERQQTAAPLKIKQVVTSKYGIAQRRMKKTVAQADLSQYQNRTIYANLVMSDDWSGTSIGAVPYGIYTMNMGDEKSFTALSTDLGFNYMSSAFGRDYFYGVRPMSVFGALTGVNYQALDTATFKVVWSDVNEGRYGLIPSVMAYDVTSDKIYSTQYNDALNGLYWASFNRKTHAFDIIQKWNNDFQPVTLAATPDGRMFAIGGDGYLYQIDKTTGDASMVGETGVSPTLYVQSMCYDSRTASFIWSAVSSAGSNLYAVNPETGAASLIMAFTKNEQIASMFFKTNEAKDKAPAGITDLKYVFSADGSTDGNVKFTIPSTAYDGSALSGNVQMSVWLDGKSLADNVTVKAGDAETFPVSLTNDNHYVYVSLKNDAGVSPNNGLYAFAGYDYPLAVTNPSLSVDNAGVSSLTWTKPAAGVNNGYIDFNNLYYQVLRMPDSLLVADQLKDTKFSETLPTKLERYSYRVTPFNGKDKKGAFAESNKVLSGKAFAVPYSENFATDANLSLFTIIDANKDEQTWQYSSWNHDMEINTVAYDIKTGCNDWLVTPAITMSKGITYGLTLNMRNTFEKYPESAKVMIGTNPSDTTTFREIAKYDSLDVKGKLADFNVDYTVPSDGDYYVAIVCNSVKAKKCSSLFLQKISIEAEGKVDAPAAVDSLTVTPDESGIMKADVAFKTPAKSLAGDALKTNVKANIYRDGDNTAVATLTNLTPGAKASWTDKYVQGVGVHKYTVAAINDAGEGKRATVSKFIGVYTPTYTETFDTESSRDFFTVQTSKLPDNNKCDWEWSSYSSSLALNYFVQHPEVHIWLFCPAIKLDANSVYDYSFVWTNSNSTKGSDGYSACGMKPDSTSQTIIKKLPKTDYTSKPVISNEIVSGQEGKYYPSIYINGDKEYDYIMATIDSISVKYVTSAFAPYSVENLKAAHDAAGALKATVTFNAPSKDYGGRALSAKMKINIFRGDNAIPVKTFTDVDPGAALTWTDDQPTKGYDAYMVVPSNDYGQGKAMTDTTYVGVDYPVAVTNFSMKGSADNQKATLAWTAPTKGQHDGVIDKSLSYYVIEYFPNETVQSKMMSILASGLKDCSYTVDRAATDTQTVKYYGVITASSAGVGKAVLGGIVLGKPYEMPYKESFNNGAETTSVWMASGDNTSYGAWVEAQDDSKYVSQDGDNGYARYYNGSYYDLWLSGSLVSPKMKLSGNGANLTFWVYQGMASTGTLNPRMVVSESVNDGAYTDISDTIMVTDSTAGWHKHTIRLANAAGTNYISLMFKAYACNYNQLFLLDNVAVVSDTADGIDAITGRQNISGIKGGISSMGFAGKEVMIYNVGGAMTDRYVSTGNDVINKPAGVYVVKVDGKSFKINVK